ncbi:MAG: alkaline phosphatase D family protein [Solirubrobacterales bacterium]|nr:alkaline phosphatase D family protein [Solirubrobacterales bacterium]
MLRFIGETEATIWVEVDEPCEVEILDQKAKTFTVEDHHFALVVLEDLKAGEAHPYKVHVAGRCVWPPEGYEFPQPSIRTIPKDGDLRLLFGSCRTSAPHHPPHTSQRWWNPNGRGIDALHTFALRMLRQPRALWPDALMMMGDQLYADQPPKNVREKVEHREVHADGPVDVLEDFEEYTVGYRDVWTYPVVRWMLSTLPSSMIFDDHEINDKWKTSQAWLDEMRQTDWYEGRVIGGLMAYWVYQHIGNLSPRELRDDETFKKLQKAKDASKLVRDLAGHAESQESHSRFSFCSDLGPARLLMLDSRAGRQLENGKRRIMSEDEWEWVKDRVDGEHKHLLMASSLPFLLPDGMHDIEAWSEAVTDGVWGKRLAPLGEKVRIVANLDHWACFQKSYREMEELVIDIATGACGEPPDTMVMFGGDVHHCFVTEVALPANVEPSKTKVWHAVCSGLRKELQASERLVLAFGHTWLAAKLGRTLAQAAEVRPRRLKTRITTRPRFRNQIGTLEIAGGEVGMRIEQVTGRWREPQLRTVIEEKLF